MRYVRRQSTLSEFCNSRGFKIVHQNVRHMLSNPYLIESFINKTESKIDNSSLYSSPGHVFLQRNRNVGACGTVGIYKLFYNTKQNSIADMT